MSVLSRNKKHIKAPATSAPANGLASFQVTQQLPVQFPSSLQPHSQSPQEKQQPQTVCPWSAHAPSFGQSPSPFPRDSHALSTSATVAGELFLFGGYTHRPRSPSNDLYVFSTQDFSTTLLQTSGDVPSPRFAHRAVLTSTTLLIWGGCTDFRERNSQDKINDDSFYLLNLVSREWTRLVVNGPGPCGRFYHTMTLVGSKLFVFGGNSGKRCLNDIWALDLDCLRSNPHWESYEPAPGDEKPLLRAGHVSVTTGDRIIIFGGCGGPYGHEFNDTWSFNISTRKWTELQCTGSIPSPRRSHAAVLIDDVMYVYGGRTVDGTYLGDLTALNLSTQRWTAFQDIGPSPGGRRAHAMASDGRRVVVLGGAFSPGAQLDDAKPIHVLDTKLLIYPEPNSNTVKHSEKTTQLTQKLSAGHLTQGQPQHGSFSSSDIAAAQGAAPFQIATSEDMGRPASPQITRERDPGLNGLPSRPTGASGRPRRVPEEDDDSESSTKHHVKPVAHGAPSGNEITPLEDGLLVELERRLSETLVTKTKRDRHIGQLTDELALKSALLEKAHANAAEEKNRAGLELRELQAKFDDLLLYHDQAEANAAEEKKRAGQQQRELQAKLDESLLSHDQAKSDAAEEKKRTRLELRELQAKLDESLLSRDHALEQARRAQWKASRAAEANERSQRELAEIHAKLEATESELATSRLQLADLENGCAKSKAKASTYRNQNTTSLVNTVEDRVMHRLMERMQVMEAEIASLRWNEKSFEMMECRNEG